MAKSPIRSLRLSNFKAFDRFDVTFPDMAVLIGPNNAGKSTVLSALKAVASMVRTARRRKPPTYSRQAAIPRNTFPLAGSAVGIEEENLRHEFRMDRETVIEARFAGGGVLRAVWPGEDADERPRYFVTLKGDPPRSLADVREAFPAIGTVPILTPLDHREKVLSTEYTQANLSSRLASRHFRNQLQLLAGIESETHRDALDEFLEFARVWLPELPLERPSLTINRDDVSFVNVFYKEGRTPKELVWAGDGVQVFVQLLLHFFRLRDESVVVLDEPDVYLHADLQRRLTRLLGEVSGQVILATHSPEILVEAPQLAGVLIDRSKRKALRVSDPVVAADLDRTMGTAFNLRLAKLLRVRFALFVEGDDVAVLRRFASTLGHTNLVTEASVAVVKLGGSANRRRLESFRWIGEELLGGAIEGYVLLDRDYHSSEAIADMRRELTRFGFDSHVWQRHELENYLVAPEPIARLVGVDVASAKAVIEEAANAMRTTVLLDMTSMRADEGPKGAAFNTIGRACEKELATCWATIDSRLAICPGKELLSAINRLLQSSGLDAVSIGALAKEFRRSEIPSEVSRVLRHVEERAAEYS